MAVNRYYDIIFFFNTTLSHDVSHILCKTTDINDPGSKSFEVNIKRKTQAVFVVHKNGEFFAYLNQCPHTGATLDWQEDQFLDLDKALIQCATHDALFFINSGECIAGPCKGQFLQVLPILIIDDEIRLDL